MRVGLLSDLHLGYGEEEIYNDFFIIARKIIEKLKDCDIIFLLGDIFDSRNPDFETIINTIKIFDGIKRDEKIKLKVNGKEEEFNKPAIFAIHGNHDRKLKIETSVLKIFEEIKILRYETFFEIIDEENKVVFYLISNFPESLIKKTLEKFSPRPKKGYLNFLMLHQNIYPYVYSYEEFGLKVTDLPKDFDLIIDAHIHLKHFEENFKLLILGSPVITRIDEREINEERGFYILEINNGKFNILFEKIEKERNYYLLSFNSEKDDENKIEEKIKEIVEKEKKKPVIKIKVYGKEGISSKLLRKIENIYKERAIIKIENLIEEKKIQEAQKEVFEIKKSVKEVVLEELYKKLEENKFSKSFKIEEVIELLEDGDDESIVDILVGEQKTLQSFK
jgi:DNA repair exonuclease SbcCD nuclease subunit